MRVRIINFLAKFSNAILILGAVFVLGFFVYLQFSDNKQELSPILQPLLFGLLGIFCVIRGLGVKWIWLQLVTLLVGAYLIAMWWLPKFPLSMVVATISVLYALVFMIIGNRWMGPVVKE